MIATLPRPRLATELPAAAAEASTSPATVRVVHLSANDRLGGAGRAAFGLHRGLSQTAAEEGGGGVRSSMLVLHRGSDDAAVHRFRPFPFLPAAAEYFLFRVCRRWQNRTLPDGELFSTGRTPYGPRLANLLGTVADLVHLHWVNDLLDYATVLPRLAARHTPMVWTLHDMNAFTGGCHYNAGCGRFAGAGAACGRCPKLGSNADRDLSRRVFARKRRALALVPDGGLTFVSPSRWLAGEVRRSALGGRFETVVIPNGVDAREFAPIDRAVARRQLGLPADARVILFVADFVNDPRKGAGLLTAALGQLAAATPAIPGLLALTLGHGDAPAGLAATGCAHRHLGRVSDNRRLALAYSAADVFVIPSLQDNLPNTILEAMACGTPVVGFDTGGMTDLIEPGRTGFLAELGRADDLAAQLRRVLADPEAAGRMGQFARRRVLERYTLEQQAAAYRELYQRRMEEAARR